MTHTDLLDFPFIIWYSSSLRNGRSHNYPHPENCRSVDCDCCFAGLSSQTDERNHNQPRNIGCKFGFKILKQKFEADGVEMFRAYIPLKAPHSCAMTDNYARQRGRGCFFIALKGFLRLKL